MVPTPDFTGYTQHFSEETLTTYWSSDIFPFVVPTPPQPPYTLFPEIPMQIFPTQIPYDATQGVVQDTYPPFRHAPDSSHAVARSTIASFDNSIRAAQWNESNGRNFVESVGPTWFPTMFPVISQSIPYPLPTPTLAPRWVKVPQRPYTHGDKQWGFKPSEPIFFSVNDFPGMNMADALRKKFTGLDGRDDPVFENTVKAISCRFLFPGYSNYSAQIPTLGWAKDRVPINRSKLAYEVAKQLNRYLESMAGQAMDGSAGRQWEIGEGFMDLEHMYLVRLVSVSTGSFRPEIWILTGTP